MMKCLALSFVLLLVASASSWATSLIYLDFSSTTGLALNNGAVAINNSIDPNNVLRLSHSVYGQNGSAFSNSTFDISSFSTTFEFRISSSGGLSDDDGPGADGIVFVIQALDPTICGGTGGNIGYGGITPSVGIEFDTWENDTENDPSGNHMGIDTNGSLMSLASLYVPTRFNDGSLKSAQINYNGTTLSVVTDGLTLSHVMDIPALLGSSSAYVGFTSSTGLAFGDHDLISWAFTDEVTPIPESATVLLLGAGLVGLAGARLRKKYNR